ncbi:MAG TPA: hypothetical protein VFN06_01480 [Gaiellaceae bacterium]|nr:hypothetical protein [Gaiellaceae bacterium]
MIRFPSGDFEYDLTSRPVPSTGETLRRKSGIWLVTRVTHELVAIVHVERAELLKSE